MQKTYVLDTNVLIHDPDCIFNFQDNFVVIPYPVIEELDKLKKFPNGKAYSARKIIRTIDNLLNSDKVVKNIYGYKIFLSNNGVLIITNKWIKHDSYETNDDIILKYVEKINKSLYEKFPQPVILITKDISFRIKGLLNGFNVEDYKTDKTQSYQKYGNIVSEKIDINSVYYIEIDHEIHKHINGLLNKIKIKNVLNIVPKTVEQVCAIDALTDKKIDMVVLNGYAGSGKTLLAIATGIYQVLKGLYERVIVLRPVIPIPGTDIGYLPGDIKEKLSPWMQPIYDNIDLISHSLQQFLSKKDKKTFKIDDIVHINALTYIRGRSLPNSFIIIDEAQNLRPLDIKTIVTRAGENSKIVFTGDLDQIDTPYLDATSSGIAYLVDKFINETNFCYLYLKETVRSRLAEQGVRLL